MIHLNNITWAQLILIGLGALFQFIALCAFVRETTAYRARKRSLKTDEHVQEQGLEFGGSDQPETEAEEMQEEVVEKDFHRPANVAEITRTEKVKFVQKFEFRRHGT